MSAERQADGAPAPELEQRTAPARPVLAAIGDVVRFSPEESGITGGGLLVDIRHRHWWDKREELRDDTPSVELVGYVAVLRTCWLLRVPLRSLTVVARGVALEQLEELAA